MSSSDLPAGLSAREWANVNLHVTQMGGASPDEAIYELRKTVVINGVPHVQFVWLTQQQLRGVGIDYGL